MKRAPASPATRQTLAVQPWAVVVVAGAVALAGAYAVAGMHPGPTTWALHLTGFLPPEWRAAVLVLVAAGAVAIAYGLLRRTPAKDDPKRKRRARGWPRLWPWLIAPAWLLLALSLRVSEPLLGDGEVWVQNVQADSLKLGSEPLAGTIMGAWAHLIEARGARIDQRSMGTLSLVAGVAAAAAMVGIAMEVGGAAWGVPLALLLFMGIGQLYFGYVETYPIALVFMLLYLWLGLRALRGATPLAAAAVALGLAAASHVGALFLYPSFAYLALREPEGRARRIPWLIIPLVVFAAAILALRYDVAQLAHPFQVAAIAARAAETPEVFQRPYALFSLPHAADVGSALLLAAPVAFLLLVAGGAAVARNREPMPRSVRFLGIAGVPGFALVCALMTPVAPAQDWDLFAFLLAPLAIAGIAMAAEVTPRVTRGLAGAGLVGLSLASLLAFAAVNASSPASFARFALLVNDREHVSPYGRAYGNETLMALYRERGDLEHALQYALLAVDAEPSNPRHWGSVGHIYSELRRAGDAIPYFEHELAAAPRRWDASFNLGLCYLSVGRNDEALPLLQRATTLSPNRPDVWHGLVQAYFRTGHRDSASVLWARVRERWPDYAERIRASRHGP